VWFSKSHVHEGAGSGYQISQFNNAGNFIWEQLAETALQKCLDSQHPEPLEPGKYTVILEPLAVGRCWVRWQASALMREQLIKATVTFGSIAVSSFSPSS